MVKIMLYKVFDGPIYKNLRKCIKIFNKKDFSQFDFVKKFIIKHPDVVSNLYGFDNYFNKKIVRYVISNYQAGIQYVSNQTDELKLLSVQTFPSSIMYIRQVTKELKAVIDKNTVFINGQRYIKDGNFLSNY